MDIVMHIVNTIIAAGANGWVYWAVIAILGIISLRLHLNRGAITTLVGDLHKAAQDYQNSKDPNSENGPACSDEERAIIQSDLNRALSDLFVACNLPSLGAPFSGK